MTNREIGLNLGVAIHGAAVAVLMMAENLHGRMDPTAIHPAHKERLANGLNAMAELHNQFAALAVDVRQHALER